MYHSCIDSIRRTREDLQKIEDFIYWIEEDAVYVVEENQNWFTITYHNIIIENKTILGITKEIPDHLFFTVLSDDHTNHTIENTLTEMSFLDQYRMRKLDKREWCLFMNNATEQFEWMIRNGKHINETEFTKLKSGES